MASVFDAFSRCPLAVRCFLRKPAASAMARLLKVAARAFGRPRYLITDQGSEFMGRVFRKTVARLRIHPRFGTVGRLFATARLERFWRSLKEIGELRLQHPSTIEDLERRLATTLTYYLCFQPHQGLSGATPAEAFLAFGRHDRYGDPPRAKPGEGASEAPFRIEYLDPAAERLPTLIRAA